MHPLKTQVVVVVESNARKSCNAGSGWKGLGGREGGAQVRQERDSKLAY